MDLSTSKSKEKTMRRASLDTVTKLLLAAVIVGASLFATIAADAGQTKAKRKRPVLFYKGDPKVCLPFLFESKKIKAVRPSMTLDLNDIAGYEPAGAVDWPPRHVDGTPIFPSGKALRFADYEVGQEEFGSLVGDRKWVRLVKRKNWPPPKEYGYVVRTKRWRRLNERCPGVLTSYPNTDAEPEAPDHFALYRVDVDNDGKVDTVLYRQYDRHRYYYVYTFTVYDLKACRPDIDVFFDSRIRLYDDEQPKLVRFRGRHYAIGPSDLLSGDIGDFEIHEFVPRGLAGARKRDTKRLCKFWEPPDLPPELSGINADDLPRAILKRVR